MIDGEAPSVNFNEEEIKTIYNITYRNYTDYLSNRIKKHPFCIPFGQQTPTMKFILFSIYFAYNNDPNLIKNILNLALKEPKYQDVIKYLRGEGVEVIIYEPTFGEKKFNGFEIENNFDNFVERSDVIIANRLENELRDVADIVYTRDLFARD